MNSSPLISLLIWSCEFTTKSYQIEPSIFSHDLYHVVHFIERGRIEMNAWVTSSVM